METKEEFITWLHEIGIIDNCSGVVSRNLDSVIAEAIAESEAKKWKPYPENLPNFGKMYWTHHIDGDEGKCVFFGDWDMFVPSRKVIAYRELPAAY